MRIRRPFTDLCFTCAFIPTFLGWAYLSLWWAAPEHVNLAKVLTFFAISIPFWILAHRSQHKS